MNGIGVVQNVSQITLDDKGRIFKTRNKLAYRLYVTPDFIVGLDRLPNAWVRFWQRIFLGFRWEIVQETQGWME